MKPSTRSLDNTFAKYNGIDEDAQRQISKRSSPIDDLVYIGLTLRRNAVVDLIEVGTFLGQSACFLAPCISGRLYTINSNPREMAIARRTVETFGIANISLVTGDSLDVLPEVLRQSGQRLGSVYIDGFHSYKYAMSEYRLVEAELSARPSGAVFFNGAGKLHPDGMDDGGVPRVVEEIGAEPIEILGHRIAVKQFGSFKIL